jgi:hypothetical protein
VRRLLQAIQQFQQHQLLMSHLQNFHLNYQHHQ